MRLVIILSWLAIASASLLERRFGTAIVKGRNVTYTGLSDPIYGVEGWLGIRYAEPPTGLRRFGRPVPYKNAGNVDAQQFGSQCFQLQANHTGESEDCLFLNVFRPIGTNRTGHHGKLPVMVWIHGGGFNRGSGNFYNPESLIQTSHDLKSPVIVVTINYRLSFFGFPGGKEATDNKALNLGLRDQRAALKWVRDHIWIWGGDHKKVTLFGQSAGGTSIGMQISAYEGKAKSLFRAAILESGSPADTAPTPNSTFSRFQQGWDIVAKSVGCSNSTDIFKCVQAAPFQNVSAAATEVGTMSPLSDGTDPFLPVVDGSFVADYPSRLLYDGKFKHIPTITGFTTDEVTYDIPEVLNISDEKQLIGLFQYVLPFVPVDIGQEIINLSPLSASPHPSGIGGTQWKRIADIGSDIFERCPGRAFARNMTVYAPSWKYRFNAILPAQLAEDPNDGVVHSAEIAYVFGTSYGYPMNSTADLTLSRIVQKAWIAFAAHLDPNALGNLGSNITWPKYHNDTEQVLVFQTTDGAQGPVGQGLHLEKDRDDRPVCDYIIAKDLDFLR